MPKEKFRAFYEYRRGKNANLTANGWSPTFDFPPHLHEDPEWILMRRGSMDILVDTQWHTLSAGDLAVVFPNTVHAFVTTDPHAEFSVMICAPSLVGETFTRLLRNTPVCPILPAEAVHPDVWYAVEGLHREAAGKADTAVLKAFVRLILARALPQLELAAVGEPQGMDLTARLADYLAHHYHEPISLQSVAKELGVSRYHVSHVFSNRFKTGFTDYVNSLRLSRACELMETDDMSLSAVSMEAGFPSHRTFNRAFQKQYGISPREYRKTIKQ